MKKLVPMFALLLAALALAACGGGDDSGDTSGVGGAIEEVEDKAGEAKEEVEDKAGEAKENAEDKAGEVKENAEDKADEAKKKAEGGSEGSAATLDFEADPSGALAYTTDKATAKAGKVTVNFTNSSPVPHNVDIEDANGEDVAETEVLTEGSDSTTATLKPGTYTFYCEVPGHRQGGMEGTLTVE